VLFGAASTSGCAIQRIHPSTLVDPLVSPEFAVISSTDEADAILTQVDLARANIETRYAKAELACHTQFFVNACLISAKEQRRVDLEQAKQSEVVANRYKRQARVDEIDRQLELKRVSHPITPTTAPTSP